MKILLVLAFVAYCSASLAEQETLVLVDNLNIRETHSQFFKSLQGKFGFADRHPPPPIDYKLRLTVTKIFAYNTAFQIHHIYPTRKFINSRTRLHANIQARGRPQPRLVQVWRVPVQEPHHPGAVGGGVRWAGGHGGHHQVHRRRRQPARRRVVRRWRGV